MGRGPSASGPRGLHLLYRGETFLYEPPSCRVDVAELYRFVQVEVLFKRQTDLCTDLMRIIDQGRLLPREGANLEKCGLFDAPDGGTTNRRLRVMCSTEEELATVLDPPTRVSLLHRLCAAVGAASLLGRLTGSCRRRRIGTSGFGESVV
eukprot:gnl/TRDRNA2_/TRDRNA2_204321_c0_seq1.p1 gnl/TRDRNA2_/TRDRNA2_204321_c0~~gnl/TRDRNA2_/TRDRNA2_204321_c0_seq1.p1  ORF type:complete len:150 (-),score=18.86 gnl/TRDRNA2_/TRDRNA2_204321_c0_seq1:31-480(-)